MRTLLLILALLAGCEDHHTPVEVERSKQRTTGWMSDGEGWIETERRVVGDAIYTKHENATEIRWFETRNLRTRAMLPDEVVPK